MKLEHCQKCEVLIDNKNLQPYTFSYKMTLKDHPSATDYFYCADCFFKLIVYLERRKFIDEFKK